MKIKTLVILGLVIILTTLGLIKLNRDYLLLSNCNTINVTTDEQLSAKKVKIEFGISVNTISRITDSELFDNRSKYIVLFDGMAKQDVINKYGENDFLITYDNQYYFSFRQFKFSRRHQHDYNFHFILSDNKIFIQTKIIGKDAMNFTRPMLEIKFARLYRCNVPIQNAGEVYNMIELINTKKSK